VSHVEHGAAAADVVKPCGSASRPITCLQPVFTELETNKRQVRGVQRLVIKTRQARRPLLSIRRYYAGVHVHARKRRPADLLYRALMECDRRLASLALPGLVRRR